MAHQAIFYKLFQMISLSFPFAWSFSFASFRLCPERDAGPPSTPSSVTMRLLSSQLPLSIPFPAGAFEIGEGAPLLHHFDGSAMIQRFALNGGTNTATFASQFIETESLKESRRVGRVAKREFGTEPPHWGTLNRLAALMSGPDVFTDNTSVNVSGKERGGEGYVLLPSWPAPSSSTSGSMIELAVFVMLFKPS